MNRKEIEKNVTVIVRTVNERTSDLCIHLLTKQISKKNMHIVSESPLSKTVRRTFEISIQENRKWNLIVDADVLIKPNFIEELYAFAEEQNDDVFEIEVQIIDKFLNSAREAGNKLYRTKYLPEAINLIPEPFEAIRPDTHVCQEMEKRNKPQVKTNILMGLHDFEQYYRDIYRKSFIQATKHPEQVEKLIPHWEKMAVSDNDFKIALSGFNTGKKYGEKVSIDINSEFMKNFEDVMKSFKLKEKKNIDKYNFFENDNIWVDVNRQYSIILLAKDIEVLLLRSSFEYRLGRLFTLPFRIIKQILNMFNKNET